MEWLIVLFFFLFGLVIGSYLNVAIYRLPLRLSTAKGRSFCPQCHHTLSAMDLIPVLSWLGLRGKCRYCHAPISPRYPLIESLTGILYALCGFYYGATFSAVLHCLFLSILIVMAMIDLDTMEIPDRLSVFILILAVIALALEPASIPSRILGALIISVPFWILVAVERDGRRRCKNHVRRRVLSGCAVGFNRVCLKQFHRCDRSVVSDDLQKKGPEIRNSLWSFSGGRPDTQRALGQRSDSGLSRLVLNGSASCLF